MKKEKTDIVLSKESRNFREKAKQLGFSNLIFALPYEKNLNLNAVDAIIINTKSLKDLREQTSIAVKENKQAIVIANNDVSRVAFENKQTWMVVMPELNHVLCNFATKNNIIIGIDFSSIKKAEIKEKAKILEKMLNIAKLCRKYKTKMVIASFAKKPEDMISTIDKQNFANSLCSA